jgi:hypothetical protein
LCETVCRRSGEGSQRRRENIIAMAVSASLGLLQSSGNEIPGLMAENDESSEVFGGLP